MYSADNIKIEMKVVKFKFEKTINILLYRKATLSIIGWGERIRALSCKRSVNLLSNICTLIDDHQHWEQLSGKAQHSCLNDIFKECKSKRERKIVQELHRLRKERQCQCCQRFTPIIYQGVGVGQCRGGRAQWKRSSV